MQDIQTAQTIFTYAYDLVLVTGLAYIGIGFVLGLIDLWQQTGKHQTGAMTAVESARSKTKLALPEASRPAVKSLQRTEEKLELDYENRL